MTLEPQAPQRCAALLLRRLRALQEAAEAWDPTSAVVKVLAVANAEAGGGTAQVRSGAASCSELVERSFRRIFPRFFFRIRYLEFLSLSSRSPTQRNETETVGKGKNPYIYDIRIPISGHEQT